MTAQFNLTRHSFKKFLRVYTLESDYKDIAAFFSSNRSALIRLFEQILDELIAVKAQICLHVVFLKSNTKTTTYFCSKVKIIPGKAIIEVIIDEIQTEIEVIADLFNERGSGWTLDKISLCEVRVGRYIPHKGGCLKNFSTILRSKKACINVNTANPSLFC